MDFVYLISGEVKNSIENNISNILNNIKVSYDLINYDLEESSLAILLEELNTIPFLYEHKVVILKSPKVLTKPSSYDPKLCELFINYIKNPIKSTTLIILIDNLKSIEPKILKVLEENCKIINIIKPNDKELKPYVEELVKNDGYKISQEAIDELIFRTKDNSDRLNIEIDKLETYCLDTKEIRAQDVRLLVNKDLDDNVFELINAVIDKNKQKAIEIYNDLVILNIDQSSIISLLVSKFNEMYQTKNLVKAGFSKDDIANINKCKPGKAYYMIKNSSSISMDTIKKNINILVDLDYKIKNGLIDKNLALELYLLR